LVRNAFSVFDSFVYAGMEKLCAEKTYPSLIVLALITALAFVTRFAGITVLATGAALIFFDGGLHWVKK